MLLDPATREQLGFSVVPADLRACMSVFDPAEEPEDDLWDLAGDMDAVLAEAT